jgi:SpoIID/LytB domain protein
MIALMKLHTLKTLFIILIAFALLSSAFFIPSKTFANDYSDISSKIEAKEREKRETEKKIAETRARIAELSKTASDLQSELRPLEAEQTKIQNQINELQNQISELDELLNQYEEILEESRQEIRQRINYLYKLTYKSPNSIFTEDGDFEKFFDDKLQTDFAIEESKKIIKELYEKVQQNKKIRLESEESLKASQLIKEEVDAKVAELKKKIAENNRALSNAQKINTELNNQVRFLSADLQKLLNEEASRLNSNPQAGQKALSPGQYFFAGRGRDLVEGHGLGMSQWGAFGMAQQGWTYDRILTFYYTDTNIGDYIEPEKIYVTDKRNLYPPEANARGYLTIDEYLSGIGEVPNSWPDEAVKAQVVAARTYVMGTCGNQKECTICGTASCQVYLGGLGKKPFVEQTKGKVILYNGAPIVAYYSASHRGKSSTVCGVWSSFNSQGQSTCTSNKPYIQPVNDDPYAFKQYFTSNPYNPSQRIYPYNWNWRTNGYTLDQLSEIFNRDSRLAVGKVTNIEVTREREVVPNGSERVYRIKIQGTNGTKYLSGWNFRSIMNIVMSETYKDYIYSTEFGFYQFQN